MHAFLSVLAIWHTGMLLLRKVAVWFGADPGNAGMPYHPIPSYFQPWSHEYETVISWQQIPCPNHYTTELG